MKTGSDSLFKISVMTPMGVRFIRAAYEKAGYTFVGKSESGGLIWLEFKE